MIGWWLMAAALAPDAPAKESLRASVMLVEYEAPAKFVGLPATCPGSPPDANPADEICLAELYQGTAVRVQHLSGPRLPRRFLLRTTAHSAHVLLSPGNRIIVAVFPFEDEGTRGYFASWWQPPDDDDRICLTDENIADLDVGRTFARAEVRVEKNPWYGDRIYRCIHV